MNFTREPIIETIITPKEGYKLAIRNTKGGDQEELFVDAVEVVSFGNSFFFRSLERPRPFLVPVTDFEVIEVKETRMVLKNVSHERVIKIGGGKEGPSRPAREHQPVEASEEEVTSEKEAAPAGERGEQRMDHKRGRDRRRNRRRRGGDERHEQRDWKPKEGESAPEFQEATAESVEKGGGADDETQVSSSIFTTLFPPPTTLISETIGKYKEKDTSLPERDVLPEQVEERAEAQEEAEEEKKKRKHHEEGSGSDTLSRSSSLYFEGQSFTSTQVYRLNESYSDPFLS